MNNPQLCCLTGSCSLTEADEARSAAVDWLQQRFRALVENSAEETVVLDARGRMTYLSPAVSRESGYSLEELADLHYLSMVHPEELPVAREASRQLLLEPSQPIRFEVRLLRKDGSSRWVEGIVANCLENPSVRGNVVNFHDVSERKRAEEALRESEEKYRSFFEENLAGNYVSTPAGRLISCNPAFARILGFDSVEAATGASLWSLYASSEEREGFLDGLRQGGRMVNHPHELRRRDGSVRQVIETAVGRLDPLGELVEIRGYLVDDTERQAAEAQLRQAQRIEAVGRLAGGVAHDFNNLLGVILGYCELLEADLGEDHPGQSRLTQIHQAADRAASLTRQLLAFSRKQVLKPELLDMSRMVVGVAPMLSRLIREDIELEISCQEPLGWVLADLGQMEQVIINLALNARDAMPGGGRLTIRTADVELDQAFARTHAGAFSGEHVLLEVRDNGHGMDAETQSRIFEPFFTTKPERQGTGLGLATVYGIVKQSGGYLGVESAPGRGATFRVYLPRVKGPSAATPEVGAALPTALGGAEIILLVEDEDSLRRGIGEVLERAGYTVVACAEPEQALAAARLRGGDIDLLLTDVVMPKMSGPQVAAEVLALRPKVKVVYMSGYTDEAIAQHGVLEAGTELITKPFTAATMLSKVRQVLDRG